MGSRAGGPAGMEGAAEEDEAQAQVTSKEDGVQVVVTTQRNRCGRNNP